MPKKGQADGKAEVTNNSPCDRSFALYSKRANRLALFENHWRRLGSEGDVVTLHCGEPTGHHHPPGDGNTLIRLARCKTKIKSQYLTCQ